ncbi:adenylyl-sulfate kinase [Sedimenticola hydrogenitrophicus]|uniref:adenylyl-sulfate kinase n=1 Tax=Sedimenticola hydrogenitrophicus TaxID=2967975 RepID=UPI0023AF80DA|nr:adenylyl-sulfate kinase [Sedimenticola hydrogenitrophicus]
MVIWLIGMSGSGKTTLGREVAKKSRKFASNTVLLDGDEVREIFTHDHGEAPYTIEGRRINAERLTALCEMLDRQGIHVVCCILSIFPEMRAGNRERFSDYFEVFMDAPLEVLEARDVKGLYAAARRGQVSNVVGIDIPFARPDRADMVIDSSGSLEMPDELATQVLKAAGLLK